MCFLLEWMNLMLRLICVHRLCTCYIVFLVVLHVWAHACFVKERVYMVESTQTHHVFIFERAHCRYMGAHSRYMHSFAKWERIVATWERIVATCVLLLSRSASSLHKSSHACCHIGSNSHACSRFISSRSLMKIKRAMADDEQMVHSEDRASRSTSLPPFH
jgi:hypothetical protein